MILDRLDISAAEFQEMTGWAIKPEGACKGDVCVPLGELGADPFDAVGVASRLGMPLVRDGSGVWALGPESVGGHALTTAVAPDLVLPDLDGNPFALRSLRGKKVVLAAWASW